MTRYTKSGLKTQYGLIWPAKEWFKSGLKTKYDLIWSDIFCPYLWMSWGVWKNLTFEDCVEKFGFLVKTYLAILRV